MRKVFEESCSAEHLYAESKQKSLPSPVGKLKGRSCKKTGWSQTSLQKSERFGRLVYLVGMAAACIFVFPIFIPAFQKAFRVLFRELKSGQEKVVHYVLEKIFNKTPPPPPKPVIPLPIPSTPPLPPFPEAKVLKAKSYETEHDEEKLHALQKAVLKRASSEKTLEMKTFITFMVEKGKRLERASQGSFVKNLNSLTDEDLTAYISLLSFEGAAKVFKPLFFVFQQYEHDLQNGSSDNIGNKLKIILKALSLDQVKACVDDTHFWALLYKRPLDAAETLSAEKLAILATKREFQQKELLHIIEKFHENDQFYPKLLAIAPHASSFIHQVMMTKASRLVKFQWKLDGKAVAKKQQKTFRSELEKVIREAYKKDQEYIQKMKAEAKKEWDRKEELRKKEPPPAPPKPFVLEKPERLQWSDAQCLEFLEKKVYNQGNVDEKEKAEVLYWILEKNSAERGQIRDFFAKSLDLTFERLKFLPPEQFLHFLYLLEDDQIEALWTFEAKMVVGQTEEGLKVSRLQQAWTHLSETKLRASVKSEKFFELFFMYPELALFTFNSEQLKLISCQKERVKDILMAFTEMTKKMNGQIPESQEKFTIFENLTLKNPDDSVEIVAKRKELSETLELKRKLIPKKK